MSHARHHITHHTVAAALLGLILLPALAGAQLLRIPPYRPVAQLGACVDGKPKEVIVTDAISSSDCSVGGGLLEVSCYCLDGAWTAGGGGAQGPEGPEGEPGAAGAAATITVGATVTGSPGSSAAVANSGTSNAAVLDFTIPRGDAGASGADGAPGATGATGPAGPVAGSDTQVVFNDGGVPAGDPGLTFTKATDVLTTVGLALPAGSLATNSVRVVQDGTGLWQPATNVLGLAANGVDVLRLNTATNGVNYVEITPQATGGGSANGPTIKAAGADASVDLNFDTKGTSGRYQFKIGGSTKLDILNDGEVRANGNFQLSSNGKYVGQSSTNIMFGNGGPWIELKANNVITLKVTDTAVLINKALVTVAGAVTIADNGNGATRATATLTATTSYINLTCSDANGCDATLSETGAQDGQLLRIVCASANVCGFADTAGVSELTGVIDLGQYDSLTLLYSADRWIETGRSNN